MSLLQAAGVLEAHYFGVAFGFVLLAAVFVVSGSVLAIGAILLAIALIIGAGILRHRHPSDVDIYLDATAWMIAGITLGTVVARAVFSSGRVTFHRVLGAVLLYLCIGLFSSRSFVLSRLMSLGRSMVSRRFKIIWPLRET